jgi:Fibronectin type III-like domain
MGRSGRLDEPVAVGGYGPGEMAQDQGQVADDVAAVQAERQTAEPVEGVEMDKAVLEGRGVEGCGQPRVDQDQASGAVTVTVPVTNTGGRAGSEVVQLYLAAPPAAGQPPRQLKGFAKVRLDPGATETVTLRLGPGDLAAYDEASGTWVTHPGRYELLVGRSSRDVRGRATVELAASRGRPLIP